MHSEVILRTCAVPEVCRLLHSLKLWCAGLCLEWGKLQEKRGEINEATKLFQRSIITDPKNPYGYQCVALLEARQHRYNSARVWFEKGIEAAERERMRVAGNGKVGTGKGLERDENDSSDSIGAFGKREEANLLHAWADLELGLGNMNETRYDVLMLLCNIVRLLALSLLHTWCMHEWIRMLHA